MSIFEVHVDDSGRGEIVVLLHSSGLSGGQWRRTAEHLVEAGARALAPDLLGCGRNAPWPEGEPFDYLEDVALVARLLPKLDEPVHLVGHSYGGLVALRVAAAAPARLRSLTLYDPVAFGVLEPERDADARVELTRAWPTWGVNEAEQEAWLTTFIDYWGGQGAFARLSAAARAELRRVGWVVAEGVRTLTGDATRAGAYGGITAPTLLVTGERSPLAAQRVVARLAEALPNARLERVEGAGHMGPLSHLARFNELLTAHLALASRAPPAG
jgi:pimeloyl-ACP methyl ester carboxylesterase